MKEPAGKRQNIWQFEYFLSRRLVWWAAISFSIGVPLIFMDPFLKGIGIQAIIWGLINSGIAVGGSYLTSRRYKSHATPSAPAVTVIEIRKVRKLLLLGLAVDGFFLLVGIALFFWLGRKYGSWTGTSGGIIFQSAVLLCFDGYHIKALESVNGYVN